MNLHTLVLKLHTSALSLMSHSHCLLAGPCLSQRTVTYWRSQTRILSLLVITLDPFCIWDCTQLTRNFSIGFITFANLCIGFTKSTGVRFEPIKVFKQMFFSISFTLRVCTQSAVWITGCILLLFPCMEALSFTSLQPGSDYKLYNWKLRQAGEYFVVSKYNFLT